MEPSKEAREVASAAWDALGATECTNPVGFALIIQAALDKARADGVAEAEARIVELEAQCAVYRQAIGLVPTSVDAFDPTTAQSAKEIG